MKKREPLRKEIKVWLSYAKAYMMLFKAQREADRKAAGIMTTDEAHKIKNDELAEYRKGLKR